jgi:autotransporter translocation and assembly factor TamB
MSPSDKPSRRRSFLHGSFKWTGRAVLGLVVLAVLLVVAAGVLWTTQGGFIAGKAAGFVNRTLLGEDTRLSIDDVEGFPFTHLVLEGVRLERKDPEGWFTFLGAHRISVSYDLWGVLHGRYAISRLEADSLRVDLRRTEEGEYLLPAGKGGGGEGSGGGLPSFRVGDVVLRGGALRLDLPWRTLAVDSVRADLSAESGKHGLDIRVEHLAGDLGGTLGRLEAVEGGVHAGDTLRIEKLRGVWAGSPFSVDGVPTGSHTDLTLRLGEFPLERLGALLEQPQLEPGYVDTLSARLTQPGGTLHFRWQGTGRWADYRLVDSSGEGHLDSDRLVLDNLEGSVNGAALSDFRVELPLHGPGLTLAGRFRNVHLQELGVAALDKYPGTLNGEGRVVLADRADPVAGLQARLSLSGVHFMEIPFRRAVVVVRGENGSWDLDTVRVDLAEASIRGGGTVGDSTLSLGFTYDGDLKPWRRFLKQENLTGAGLLHVRLTGTRTRPYLSAQGKLTHLSVAQLRAPLVELHRAEGIAANPRHLELEFRAPRGIDVGNTFFSSAAGSLTVTDSVMVARSLALSRGDTTVTVAGTLRWEPFIRAEIAQARAALDGRKFWVDTGSTLIFRDDVLSTPGILVRTPRGSVKAEGKWNAKTNAIEGRFTLDDLDFSVFFPPQHPPAVRVGSATGVVSLSGTAPILDGDARITLKAVDWEGGHLDSLVTELKVSGRDIQVERLETALGAGQVRVSGGVRLPLPLYQTLEAMAVGPDLDPDSLTWDLTGSVTGVRLFQWLSFVSRPDRPSGLADATLRLSGSAAEPRMRFMATLRKLVWRQFEADSLVARLGYSGGTVTVDTLRTWQGTRRVDVTGTAPLDLTLYPFAWELPNRQMDLRVDAAEGDLNNLRLTPWVAEAEGTMQVHVRIFGTPSLPLVDGRARVADAVIRPADRDEVLKNVTADIEFDRDLVTVKEAHADLGGGTVTAQGTYRLHASQTESYEMVVNFDKAVVRQEGTYAARVSGKITLKPTRASDGLVYPYAEGDIFVHRAEYAGSLQPQDIGQFKPQPILYNVRINAPSKVIIATEDVNVELGGEVTVRQGVDSRSVLGEMDILHGTYQLFLEDFRITDGKLTWNVPTTVLPQMDVTAQTQVASYLVIVNLTGPANEPVIQFSAQMLDTGTDAGLTQSEIIQLLAVGMVNLSPETVGLRTGETQANGNTPGVEQQVLGAAGGLAASQLERELVRQLGIVDELQIQPGFTEGKFAPTLEARKWLTPELSVAYRQGLSRNFDQDIAVEYRLRRSLYLRGEVLRRQGTTQNPGTTQEYNVDLKVRHDY